MKKILTSALLLCCMVRIAHAQGSCLHIKQTVTHTTGCSYTLHLDIENPTAGKKSFTITNGSAVVDTINVNDGETTTFDSTYSVASCDPSSLRITIYTAPDAGGTDCGMIILPVAPTLHCVVLKNEIQFTWDGELKHTIEQSSGHGWAVVWSDPLKQPARIPKPANGTYFYRADDGPQIRVIVTDNNRVDLLDINGVVVRQHILKYNEPLTDMSIKPGTYLLFDRVNKSSIKVVKPTY